EGMVFDPAGALPEARVTISGPSLQGTRVARCDREGRFHFPLLPVGTYEARVDLLGHRDAIISGIRVDLGRTTDLGTVRLEVEAIAVEGTRIAARRVASNARRPAIGGQLSAEAM